MVEQTAREVAGWLCNLGKRASHLPEGTHDEDEVVLQVLMGGADREDDAWQLAPGRRAVLIGTQDMLLSRALNRGYLRDEINRIVKVTIANEEKRNCSAAKAEGEKPA